MEARLAVTVEPAQGVDAHLVAVTGVLVSGTLVNIDTIVPNSSKSVLAGDSFRRGQRVVVAGCFRGRLGGTLKVAVRVYAYVSRVTGSGIKALVDI